MARAAAAALGAIVAVLAAAAAAAGGRFGLDREAAVRLAGKLSRRLGAWAIPVYVVVHALTLALCLPYAVFFEAAAPLLFGFLPAVACVVAAKVLGASLSFLLGRAILRSSKSAMEWATRSKYFPLIARGVEQDGWKFVLLARFSPLPSYVINYALAATGVGFFVDFLVPTVIGCLPMVLQNTSIGSLAGAAVSSTTGSKKGGVSSYLFPLLGIASSILISLRIKKYSSELSVSEEDPSSGANGNMNGHSATESSPSSADRYKKRK